MHLHQPARQCQPDAQATGGAIENRFRLVEHVEHPREDVGGNSYPRIADPHDGLVGLLVGGEPDVPATRRELHRVVQDIGEDLHQPRAITVDKNWTRGQRCVQCLTRRRGERRDGFGRGRHQAGEVERFATQLDSVGGDPGHIQEIIDEAHELFDLTLDHIAGTGRSGRRGVELEGLQRKPYRCQRVPELVRERREELVLALIGFSQLGRAIADPELQVPVQRFRLVLGSSGDSRSGPGCRIAA